MSEGEKKRILESEGAVLSLSPVEIKPLWSFISCVGLWNPVVPSVCSSHSWLSALISAPHLTEQWLMCPNSKRHHHTWWGCSDGRHLHKKQFYGALPLMELQRLNPSEFSFRWSLQPCSVHVLNTQLACFLPCEHECSSMYVYVLYTTTPVSCQI